MHMNTAEHMNIADLRVMKEAGENEAYVAKVGKHKHAGSMRI